MTQAEDPPLGTLAPVKKKVAKAQVLLAERSRPERTLARKPTWMPLPQEIRKRKPELTELLTEQAEHWPRMLRVQLASTWAR